MQGRVGVLSWEGIGGPVQRTEGSGGKRRGVGYVHARKVGAQSRGTVLGTQFCAERQDA